MTVAVKKEKTVSAPRSDEYSPEQRRKIDADLDAAWQRGFHDPFKGANEMIVHIENTLRAYRSCAV